jgi:hypothetical protein
MEENCLTSRQRVLTRIESFRSEPVRSHQRDRCAEGAFRRVTELCDARMRFVVRQSHSVAQGKLRSGCSLIGEGDW